MAPTTPDIAKYRLDMLMKFESVVREVFRGERWADIEPFAARAFALLEMQHDLGDWCRTRDYLQATWPHRRLP